jgi:hypothetical protein
LPVRVLSSVFRGKFLDRLRQAYDRGDLRFRGKLEHLNDPKTFRSYVAVTYRTPWVVYSKPPFGGPEQVLKYLARYTHRVAISNHRLLSLSNAKVAFAWKDYANGGRRRVMKLDAVEFLRRFLLHVLPKGFVRLRHYGFLSNRNRKAKLRRCRELLATASAVALSGADDSALDADDCDTNEDYVGPRCPACGRGNMAIVLTFTKGRRPTAQPPPRLQARAA